MRWIRRGALGVLVGVVATVAAANPAFAADNRVHTLSMGGTLRIVDFDSPDNDDICNKSTNKSVTLQFPVTQTAQIGWNNGCDEVDIKLRAEASINSSGTMTVRVVVELWEEDCTVWVCDSDRITTKTWTRTISTGGTGRITNGFVDGGDEGSATLNLSLSNTAP